MRSGRTKKTIAWERAHPFHLRGSWLAPHLDNIGQNLDGWRAVLRPPRVCPASTTRRGRNRGSQPAAGRPSAPGWRGGEPGDLLEPTVIGDVWKGLSGNTG